MRIVKVKKKFEDLEGKSFNGNYSNNFSIA